MLRTLVMVALVLLVAAVLATPAFAEAWQGEGTIHCEGSGAALVRGDGEVSVTSRRGALWFKDFAGDGQIEISGVGRKWELPGGAILWYGFNGSAQASGSRIAVGLRGRHITLDAEGRGQLRAAGRGFCQVGDKVLNWTPAVQSLELVPEE